MSKGSFQKYGFSYKIVLPLLSFYTEMAEKSSDFLYDSECILDIGSGPGLLSGYLNNQMVVSVDYEYSMLDKVLTSINADAQALPFKASSFDGVAALNLLQFVPDYEVFFSEVNRVTIREGTIVVAGIKRSCDLKKVGQRASEDLAPYIDNPNYTGHIKRVMEWNKKDLIENVRNWFTLDDVCCLFDDNGFDVIERDYVYLGQSYFVIGKKR